MYIYMYIASQHWNMINFPPTITPLFESETVSVCFLIEYLTHNCSVIKIICQRPRQSYIYIYIHVPGNVLHVYKWALSFLTATFWNESRILDKKVAVKSSNTMSDTYNCSFEVRGIDAHVLHGKSKCARSWFSDDKVTLQISLWQFVHIFLLYFQTSDSSHLF